MSVAIAAADLTLADLVHAMVTNLQRRRRRPPPIVIGAALGGTAEFHAATAQLDFSNVDNSQYIALAL